MTIYQEVGTEKEKGVTREQYELIDGISVDFGIMQKTRRAYVIKSNFVWDDIGSFASLSRFIDNYRGNSVNGNIFLEQSENCSIFGKEKLIIGFGIKDLVIVDAGDVMLIMDKNKDQEIKSLVNTMKGNEKLGKYL